MTRKLYKTTFKVGRRTRTWKNWHYSLEEARQWNETALENEYYGKARILEVDETNPPPAHQPGH